MTLDRPVERERSFSRAELLRLFQDSPANLDGPAPADSTGSATGFDHISELCPDVVHTPFLSRNFCDLLVAFLETVAVFRRDEGRDAFAAPEARLRDVSPQIEAVVARAIAMRLTPIMFARWSVVPSVIHPPFVIRYALDTQTGMARHHDRHSDVSISVPLNDDFDGGGLFFPRQRASTRGLPVGTAVLFPGRVSHPHQALPITRGRRYVLTVWTEHREAE